MSPGEKQAKLLLLFSEADGHAGKGDYQAELRT